MSECDDVVKQVHVAACELKEKMAMIEIDKEKLESLRVSLNDLEDEREENAGAEMRLSERIEVETVLLEDLKMKLQSEGSQAKKKRLHSEINSAEEKRMTHEAEIIKLKADAGMLVKEMEMQRAEELMLEERINSLAIERDQIIEDLIDLDISQFTPAVF